eukprot:TRINITY_DN808_c0_g1_i1.p1 TRINITY_DN808_c0_g1~~TRINITY_DN808_c0_g1_i1.p1  ORF type:complete len:1008 (+),score=203.91 TRINITY_DN808_c0_g1_i1:376-3024(+)
MSQISLVFSNWDALLKCHRAFLEQLRTRLLFWSTMPYIADLFLDTRTFQIMYTWYVNNYDSATTMLHTLKVENRAFRQFIEEFDHGNEKRSETDKLWGLHLESFLIMPVQRFPRYLLLLQTLLKDTPSNNQHYPVLSQALGRVREMAESINRSKRLTDTRRKVTAALSTIQGWKDDDGNKNEDPERSLRSLIREGPIIKKQEGLLDKDKRIYMFLFSDILVYAAREKNKKYKFKGSAPLRTSSLTLNQVNGIDVIVLKCQAGTLRLTSDDPAITTDQWYKDLGNAIKMSIKDMLSHKNNGGLFKSHEERKDRSPVVDKLRRKERGLSVGTVMDIIASSSDPGTTPEEQERLHIAYTIWTMEKKYLDELITIDTSFAQPLLGSLSGRTPLISEADYHNMFGNLDDLIIRQTRLVDKVNDRLSKWEHLPQLGDIYSKPRWLSTLAEYIESHEAYIQPTLDRNLAQPQFVMFCHEAERTLKTAYGKLVTLGELLKMPVTHMSKCYVLLEDLLQHSDVDSMEYKMLNEVVTAIQGLNQNQIDRFKRMSTMQAHVAQREPSWKFWKRNSGGYSPRDSGSSTPHSSPGSPSSEPPNVVVGLNPIMFKGRAKAFTAGPNRPRSKHGSLPPSFKGLPSSASSSTTTSFTSSSGAESGGDSGLEESPSDLLPPLSLTDQSLSRSLPLAGSLDTMISSDRPRLMIPGVDSIAEADHDSDPSPGHAPSPAKPPLPNEKRLSRSNKSSSSGNLEGTSLPENENRLHKTGSKSSSSGDLLGRERARSRRHRHSTTSSEDRLPRQSSGDEAHAHRSHSHRRRHSRRNSKDMAKEEEPERDDDRHSRHHRRHGHHTSGTEEHEEKDNGEKDPSLDTITRPRSAAVDHTGTDTPEEPR